MGDRECVLALQGWMIDAQAMDAMSMAYNYFTVNGKSYPATTPITANPGGLVRLRFVNPSQTIHPVHLHGTDMAIVAKDGEALEAPRRVNTLTLEPGDTYDVLFRADNPGRWILHCHDLHHASNDGTEPGGLIVEVRVGGGAMPTSPFAPPSTRPTPVPSGMTGRGHESAAARPARRNDRGRRMDPMQRRKRHPWEDEFTGSISPDWVVAGLVAAILVAAGFGFWFNDMYANQYGIFAR
ncbi:MAG TPA: multicopper oxidase domain-containing protein [Candidatus Limnocylindria bacterium]|nr:multicopper oxidase domain-containing protein [Candidatus Limnocylindria bacterium]